MWPSFFLFPQSHPYFSLPSQEKISPYRGGGLAFFFTSWAMFPLPRRGIDFFLTCDWLPSFQVEPGFLLVFFPKTRRLTLLRLLFLPFLLLERNKKPPSPGAGYSLFPPLCRWPSPFFDVVAFFSLGVLLFPPFRRAILRTFSYITPAISSFRVENIFPLLFLTTNLVFPFLFPNMSVLL